MKPWDDTCALCLVRWPVVVRGGRCDGVEQLVEYAGVLRRHRGSDREERRMILACREECRAALERVYRLIDGEPCARFSIDDDVYEMYVDPLVDDSEAPF